MRLMRLIFLERFLIIELNPLETKDVYGRRQIFIELFGMMCIAKNNKL